MREGNIEGRLSCAKGSVNKKKNKIVLIESIMQSVRNRMRQA